jgi:hypothetical protein
VLETMVGDLRLQEACADLDVCKQRFHQLRDDGMQGLVHALEPRKPGRRAAVVTPLEEENRALKAQLAEVQRELAIAKAREEVALVLPRVVHPRQAQDADVSTPAGAAPDRSAEAPKKKRRGRPRKPSRPPPPGPRRNA